MLGFSLLIFSTRAQFNELLDSQLARNSCLFLRIRKVRATVYTLSILPLMGCNLGLQILILGFDLKDLAVIQQVFVLQRLSLMQANIVSLRHRH